LYRLITTLLDRTEGPVEDLAALDQAILEDILEVRVRIGA